MSKKSRTRAKTKMIPRLQSLTYQRDGKPVFCEMCKNTINVGDRFAWWEVDGGRATAYCQKNGCHWENVKAGRAVR